MAKKSYKRLALSEKDNPGCMWGLISMLDFREVHVTGKLLPEKKQGHDTAGTEYSKVKDLSGFKEKHTSNIDGSRSGEVNFGITTIKRLMEGEMSRENSQNRIPSEEFQFIISDFGSGVQNREYCRERSSNSKEIFNAVDSLTTISSMDNQQPESISSNENSSVNFDLAAFLIEFYGYSDKCRAINVDSNDILNLCLSFKTLCEKLQSNRDQPHVMLDQKDTVIRRALIGVAEDIVSQSSINEKTGDEKMCIQSNELIDSFKILNSKRELLLKLLQDPDSPLFKYAQDTQNTQVAKHSKLESAKNTEKVRLFHKKNGSSDKCEETDSAEMSRKQSKTIFFWNKHKTKRTKTSRGSQNSQPSNRIIVLKPNPERVDCPPITRLASSSTTSKHNQGHEEDGERVTSHFSLNEIKRRLKHAFREKKIDFNMISRDSVLHKIPVGCKYSVETSNQFGNETVSKRSARRSSCANEKSTDTLTISKDKKLNAEGFELNIRRDCASPSPGYMTYEEAKKHLAKRRSTGNQINRSPTVQISKSSGKILSLPGCNISPCPTVENKKETTSFIMEMEHSPMEHLARKDTKSIVSSLTESSEVSSGSESKENSQLLMFDLKKQLIDGHMEEESCVQEGLNQGGSIDLDKAKVDISMPAPYQSEVLMESSNKELDDECNIFKEECSTLESDSIEEKPQSAIQFDSSPSSPIIKKLFTLGYTTEMTGRTIVSEDMTSPGGRDVHHDKFQMQPQHPNFEYNDNSSTDLMRSDMENDMIRSIDESQAKLQYVKAVLHAAGLTTSNGFSERWLLGDKLLDPFLFDEVRTSCCPVLKDQKLLFDWISDVLVEIHERYFKHGIYRYFINSSIQPALLGAKLMKEITMRITKHKMMQLPTTVDEIIQKDLQSEAWVNFQLETENIAIDVCDTILDDMVEEAVFDLWF